MKTVGIIGGIGPESTIEYYRLILAGYRRRRNDESAPRIVINSIDVNKMLEFIARSDLNGVTLYLTAEVDRLNGAGADFAALAANTPHIVFDAIQANSVIPLISIVEATRSAAKAHGFRKLGLFGTRFTMQERFYPEVFAKDGIDVVPPGREESDYVHHIYMNELLKGIFLDETREQLLKIIQEMKERDGVEAIILGGTELPFILSDEAVSPIPLLNTTQIHVDRILQELLDSPIT